MYDDALWSLSAEYEHRRTWTVHEKKRRRRRKTKQIGNNSFASSWMLALFYVHAVLCGIVTLTVCHPIVRFERILECVHCTVIHISECNEIHKRLTVHKYTAHCDGMSGYTHTCVSTYIERDRTQKQMKKKNNNKPSTEHIWDSHTHILTCTIMKWNTDWTFIDL